MTCAECDRLRAELRRFRMRERFDIGPGRAAILARLYDRSPNPVSAASLLAAAHGRDHAHIRSRGLLAVHIHCLRQLLGAEIRLESGIGYSLTAEGRAMLDEMLA